MLPWYTHVLLQHYAADFSLLHKLRIFIYVGPTWVIIPSLPARCVRSNGVIKWGWVITTPKHICTKTWECPDTSKAIWSSYSLSIENKEICSYYKKCQNCLEYFLGTIISLVPLSFSHNVKKTCFSWGNVSPGFELKGTFDGLKGWFSLSSM